MRIAAVDSFAGRIVAKMATATTARPPIAVLENPMISAAVAMRAAAATEPPRTSATRSLWRGLGKDVTRVRPERRSRPRAGLRVSHDHGRRRPLAQNRPSDFFRQAFLAASRTMSRRRRPGTLFGSDSSTTFQ